MRVAYIAGWMRSGTTLLGEMLGAQPNVFNAGEVSGIWIDASNNGVCACGEGLLQCPVWEPAFDRVMAECEVSRAELTQLGETTQRVLRTRNLPTLLSRAPQLDPETWRMLMVTKRLLEIVMHNTGDDLLVDSSKLTPGIARYLLTNDEIRVVHISRDPRAVAASAQRTAMYEVGNRDFMPPGAGLTKTVLHWYGANASISALAMGQRLPWQRVTYEGLMRDPASVLSKLGEWLKIGTAADIVTERKVEIGKSHAAVGNPGRLKGGVRELREDLRWKQELSPAGARAIAIATAPMSMALSKGSLS